MTEAWKTQEGLIIWQGRHGDRGRVLHILTADEGLVHVYYQTSKNEETFDELVRGEFVYLPGRGNLKRLREWRVHSRYQSLRESYALLECAAAMCKALRLVLLPDLPVPKLYALICYYLEHLSKVENPRLLQSSFYLRLLRHESLLQFPLEENLVGEEEAMLWEILALSPSLSTMTGMFMEDEQHSQIEDYFYVCNTN